jgi:hypothetical protein
MDSYHGVLRRRLFSLADSNQVPHLMLWGSPGSGKRALLRELLARVYGGPPADHLVMWVECGRGKGIKFVREELKFFAQSLVISAPFKSIVLQDACCLTFDAQSALRRCIELYSRTTRFFLVLEDRTKILGPIVSRLCAFYVPRPLVGGRRLNLHRLALAQRSRPPDTMRVAARLLGKHSVPSPELAELLYQKACTVYDLMAIVEKSDIEDGLKYAYLDYIETVRSTCDDDRVVLYLASYLYLLRPLANIENVPPA